MISLREITEADLHRIRAWREDREIADQLSGPFRYTSPETEREWFDAWRKRRDRDLRLAVCRSEDGAHIGNVYLLGIDPVALSAELHLLIGDSACRGRGYGTAAVRAGLGHAFGDLNLHRVWLRVLEGNAPALAVYRKCGFREEGRARDAAFKNGRYRDMIHMAILAEEFGAR